MQVKSIAECSKGEHSAILLTCIKLPFTLKSLFCLFLSGCFSQVYSKRQKIGFQDQLLLNAGQEEHSAILSTCLKLPFVINDIKIFVLSIFEWSSYTGFLYVSYFVFSVQWKEREVHCHHSVVCFITISLLTHGHS